MGRFLALLALAVLTAAEVGAVLALVDALGPGNTLLVLALDVLAGFLVMRWALASPREERGWRLAAGAVIALPGLVLDLVGLSLLVPAFRDWVGRSVLRGTESALRRRGISVVTVTDPTGTPRPTFVPGEVIQGTVVESDVPDDQGSAPPDPRGRPGGQPPAVRGEIVEGPEER